MFSLFPNSDAPLSGWLASHSGAVILVGAVLLLCSLLAWHFHGRHDGMISADGDSCSSDGGDCGGD